MTFKHLIRVFMTQNQTQMFGSRSTKVLEALKLQYGEVLQLVTDQQIVAKLPAKDVVEGKVAAMVSGADTKAVLDLVKHLAKRNNLVGFLTDPDRLRLNLREQIHVAILAAMLGPEEFFDLMVYQKGADSYRAVDGLHRMNYVAEVLEAEVAREFFAMAA